MSDPFVTPLYTDTNPHDGAALTASETAMQESLIHFLTVSIAHISSIFLRLCIAQSGAQSGQENGTQPSIEFPPVSLMAARDGLTNAILRCHIRTRSLETFPKKHIFR